MSRVIFVTPLGGLNKPEEATEACDGEDGADVVRNAFEVYMDALRLGILQDAEEDAQSR